MPVRYLLYTSILSTQEIGACPLFLSRCRVKQDKARRVEPRRALGEAQARSEIGVCPLFPYQRQFAGRRRAGRVPPVHRQTICCPAAGMFALSKMTVWFAASPAAAV